VSKPLLEVAALSLLLSLSITFMVVFNIAVLNGGSTTVILTLYDEMVAELLLLNVVVWPTISAGLYHYHRYR